MTVSGIREFCEFVENAEKRFMPYDTFVIGVCELPLIFSWFGNLLSDR